MEELRVLKQTEVSLPSRPDGCGKLQLYFGLCAWTWTWHRSKDLLRTLHDHPWLIKATCPVFEGSIPLGTPAGMLNVSEIIPGMAARAGVSVSAGAS